jgi:hypothetical protein
LYSLQENLSLLIARAGERAACRFLEFFTVNIRKKNTRVAYWQAPGAFLLWCRNRLTEIDEVKQHG